VLGLLLLVVALIGWRCTPTDNEPCHLLFGLGSYSMVQQRQFVRGHHRRANRFHWIGGEAKLARVLLSQPVVTSLLSHNSFLYTP